jgi:hypothetical protein
MSRNLSPLLMSQSHEGHTLPLVAAENHPAVEASVAGASQHAAALGSSAVAAHTQTLSLECPVPALTSSAVADNFVVTSGSTPPLPALGGGSSVRPTSPNSNGLNRQSLLPVPSQSPSCAAAGSTSFAADAVCSILAELCAASGADNHEQICCMLRARLDDLISNDSVAALRGRHFVVKRASGALESDWQLVFGAQVEQKEEKEEEEEEEEEEGIWKVQCYQASSDTFRVCTVQSLQKQNADLFQAFASGAPSGGWTAQVSPLYHAELLYMLACQEPDMSNNDDAVLTEGCARQAYIELCMLKGDVHVDTLLCLATLTSKFRQLKKITEAKQCFAKFCEGMAATYGKDHENTLGIQEAFAEFLKEQQEYDAARSLFLQCFDSRLKSLGPYHRRTLRSQFYLVEIEICEGDAAKIGSAISLLKESLAECLKRTSREQLAEFINIGYFPSIVHFLASSYGTVALDCATCIACVGACMKDLAPIVKLLEETFSCDKNGDGSIFVPLLAVLQSEANRKNNPLVLSLFRVLEEFVEMGRKVLDEHGRNPYLVSLERRGFFDTVVGLQANGDVFVCRLANICVMKYDILKTLCSNLGADEHSVAATACGRLRQTLHAHMSDAVVAIILESDAAGHLVRLLTSATANTGADGAACIGFLSNWVCRHWDSCKKANVVANISKLLRDSVCHDANGNATCFHSFVSVMGSVEGVVRFGLVNTLENFLLTYGDDVVCHQLVASLNILSTCLGILRSSSSSECFRSVLSILRKILQSGHMSSHGASCTTNPYVADLNALGAVQVLQSVNNSCTADTISILDEVLQYFYEFFSLEERLRLLVSQRPVPPSPALRPRPQNLIMSSLRGDICTLEAHPEWLNIDEKERIVRFFVSSTFDDTKHERDVLIKCVLPALQHYARSVGFEVVLSEMRFGIRKNLGDDHKTTEVCMTELQRCIETSAGLSYMLLSCNRSVQVPSCSMRKCDTFAGTGSGLLQEESQPVTWTA